jgi:tRNA pseudouridine38-40 synthase
MKRIKLTIAYDGTNYCGWQIQNNAVTIQQIIEEACQKLFSREIKLIGASRTDTGVHALGQVATIDVDTTIPSERIAYALNANLPDDIVIQESGEVDCSFHPRYEAKEKTYQYNILNAKAKIPQYRLYHHYVSRTLRTELMEKAADFLIGEHDFKSFCSAHSSVKSTVRTIYDVSIVKEDPFIRLQITGNGFLYNMVRIISGTLIDVGLQRISPEDFLHIIKSKDRSQAGATAPAQGLTLLSIKY